MYDGGSIQLLCFCLSPIRTKELEIEVCKLKCEVISLIQGNIKIPLKGQYYDRKTFVN